jgi:formamidopyrimidine-DNA glycosylase
MLELPEALTIARQVQETVAGRRIVKVVAAHTPHKFAWYHGDPNNYHSLLAGKIIAQATAWGGMIKIEAGDAAILIGDGIGLRFHRENDPRPGKHQLLIELDDFSALTATVQMYGGL